jgi:NAD(P)-dependent dehydrogenase (short-subunit alcohol dehydrogenase family)
MIIITGASGGLGLQIAKVYKSAGKRVVNVSRRESEFATDNMLADLSDESALAKAVDSILAIDEPIEALINCAGVMSLEHIDAVTAGEVDRVLAVNVRAPILLTSGLASRLQKDGSDIVNVASTVGLKAYPDQAAYGASKWAMRGFSQNLQVEFKATNRVISFCVGGFRSDIVKKVTGKGLPDPENWMDPADIAAFMKQILELPKGMEVSEIVINRRPAKR